MHPLLTRLARTVSPSLAWVAALVFAWVLFATLPGEVRGALRPGELSLHGTARAGIAVAAALPVVLARRAPVSVFWLLLVEVLAASVTGLTSLRWSGRRRPLSPEIDVSAFRIIQEAVTNVVRHAGTPRCSVAVEFRDRELAVEVLDDGRGAAADGPAEGAGYGLVGMRERVSLLRGDFSAGPRPEGGFRVTARIPA